MDPRIIQRNGHRYGIIGLPVVQRNGQRYGVLADGSFGSSQPPPEPPPPDPGTGKSPVVNYRLTEVELFRIQKGVQDGLWATAGGMTKINARFTTSPALWQKVIADSNTMLAEYNLNPTNHSDRWNTTYAIGVERGRLSQAGDPWTRDPALAGYKMMAAAFRYMVTGEAQYGTMVKKDILRVCNDPDLDMSNRVHWPLGSGNVYRLSENNFTLAEFQRLMIFSMGCIKPLCSTAEWNTILNQVWYWVEWWYAKLSVEFNANFPNREEGNFTLSTGGVNSNNNSTMQRRFWHRNAANAFVLDERGTLTTERSHNNKRACSYYMVGLGAHFLAGSTPPEDITTTTEMYRNEFSIWTRQLLTHGISGDGLYIDLFRFVADQSTGKWQYLWATLTTVLQWFNLEARAGRYDDLFYTTGEGTARTEVIPSLGDDPYKSWPQVFLRMGEMFNGDIKLYKTNVEIASNLMNGNLGSKQYITDHNLHHIVPVLQFIITHDFSPSVGGVKVVKQSDLDRIKGFCHRDPSLGFRAWPTDANTGTDGNGKRYSWNTCDGVSPMMMYFGTDEDASQIFKLPLA